MIQYEEVSALSAVETSTLPSSSRCRYPSKICMSPRCFKRDGSLHRFCQEHRESASMSQRLCSPRWRMQRCHFWARKDPAPEMIRRSHEHLDPWRPPAAASADQQWHDPSWEQMLFKVFDASGVVLTTSVRVDALLQDDDSFYSVGASAEFRGSIPELVANSLEPTTGTLIDRFTPDRSRDSSEVDAVQMKDLPEFSDQELLELIAFIVDDELEKHGSIPQSG